MPAGSPVAVVKACSEWLENTFIAVFFSGSVSIRMHILYFYACSHLVVALVPRSSPFRVVWRPESSLAFSNAMALS